MREVGKMDSTMVKVRKVILLILTLFNPLLGKKFWFIGNIYEGEWKDGIEHG